MTYFSLCPSPVGTLLLISDGKSLTGLTFGSPEPHWKAQESLAIFNSTKRWLNAYFAGKPTVRDFSLALSGTTFQHRVWDLLAQIPYGETVTYGQLAKQLGGKISAQAVGQAVGKNPIAIIIPCHRVVGAGGQLTGYAWGMERKHWLLRHEEETK
jgi:methylated-DNA-[protein]-cysteine S-methyltransferase